ncbi:MAG: peptide-methionine (S)-S-oxide reductase MsrA [Acidiferrobacterales bacterium]
METTTLGGGCFWCLEAVFEQVAGVESVESGYSGGTVPNPTYQAVCSGETGHAEVVQIRFDPTVVSFRDILEVFFAIHDPTTPDRQGGDVGTQYRSVIFYHSPNQKEIAEAIIRELDEERRWPAPIVTEVVAFDRFYSGEAYHQGYYRQNSSQPYCRMVIDPKISKFREKFMNKLKRTATLDT